LLGAYLQGESRHEQTVSRMSAAKSAFKWEAKRQERRAEFGKLLDDEELRRDVFNEKYFDALERRKDALAAAFSKSQMVILIGTLFLGLSVLSVHLPVSVFGLSAQDAGNLREILLVGVSTVQISRVLPEIERANITDLLMVLVSKVAKGNEAAARALRVRYGIDNASIIPSITTPAAQLSAMQKVTFLLASLGLVGWLLLSVSVVLLIQLFAMIDVLRNPSISFKVSVWVVLYVVFVDLASIGINRMTSVGTAYANE
jgi:hypothetical protein